MEMLFQGIAEMAGREEKSRYELLEISDPSNLLVRGRDFISLYSCIVHSNAYKMARSHATDV